MAAGMLQKIQEKKIESAIRELEYTPNELARNLFKNRTGIIGVLVPDLDHPFFSAFTRETEIALYKAGYKVMICNTIGSSNRELDYLNMLDRNMVDGIINRFPYPSCGRILKKKENDRVSGSGFRTGDSHGRFRPHLRRPGCRRDYP